MSEFSKDSISYINSEQAYNDLQDIILSYNFEKGKKRVEKIFAMSNELRYTKLDAPGITNYLRFLASESPIDIDLLLPTILAYGRIVLNITDVENKDRVACLCLFDSFYRKTLRLSLPEFVARYQHTEINDLSFSQSLKDIFNAAGIFNVDDLVKLSANSLIALAFYDLENFLNIVCNNQFFQFYANKMVEAVDGISYNLSPLANSYFCLKCDTTGGHFYTDDEIYSLLGATKSNIEKAELSEQSFLSTDAFLPCWKYGLYVFYALKKDKTFLTFDEAKSLLGEDYTTFLYRMFYWNEKIKWSPIVVDTDLHLIYDSNIITIDDIITTYYSDLPLSISPDSSSYTNTEKAIVERRNNPNKYNTKKVPHISKMVRDVLERDFAEGYRVGSNQDFEMLKNFIKVRYGVSPNQLTPHAVASLISKDSNFVLCDRGTYRLRYLCPKISNNLLHRIIDYIINYNSKTVFYATIYDYFEYELRNYGINNAFLFKGLLDPSLPPDMNTKRNYIIKTKSSDDTSYNAGQNLIAEIRKFSGLFSLDDLRKVFPGLKDYVLYNYLYGEEQNNLIFLRDQRFIYLDKLNITENDINDLHEYIETSFSSNGHDILSLKVLYSRLCQINKNLIKRINNDSDNLFNDEFSFFSLVRQLFPTEYFYDRPFISKIGGIKLTVSSVIAYYLKDLKIVSHDNIRHVAAGLGSTTTNLNLDEINNYLSDTHVLVNYSTLVKKESFILNDEDRENIQEVIDHYLSMEEDGTVSTTEINYKLLPTFNYPWNGHLLAGILRSYFRNTYEVKKEDKIIKHESYTIRRK